MTEPRTYPAGVPCWIDLESPDADAAREFYGRLFGWTFENAMPPGAPGHYFIARLGGRDVAAIGMPGDEVCVEHVRRRRRRRRELSASLAAAGATIVAEPWTPAPVAAPAVLRDPGGATFRLWQARRRLGAQAVNEPGTWNFSDLHTADPAAAEAFYGGVFGWESDHLDGRAWWCGAAPATATTSRRRAIRRSTSARQPCRHRPGSPTRSPGWPRSRAGEEPHWHVTFAVADRDEAIATALALGGTDLRGPVDTPWTKMAVVRDPQGAVFTLSQFTPPG